MVKQCYLIVGCLCIHTNLKSMVSLLSQLFHQLLSNSDHSLNESIRSWMVRAAGVVCDVVTLQKLLEFLGIVAWSIVTSDDVG